MNIITKLQASGISIPQVHSKTERGDYLKLKKKICTNQNRTSVSGGGW